ncbi:very short patch repair endonuclease [Burkholderia glumae]|uniref:very short patch repair endonuclease n=1 Tax=Burkholderia glumae TaxID=337 RepID=UPI0009B77880|nr:very short patch repair endonuclease [Burkholderia glumae]
MDRKENMRRIRSKDTRPEVRVRGLLRRLGYVGYRLHRADLPGKPDIAFVGQRKAILVHGCFWHGHNCKRGGRRPKTNLDYWQPKIERNQRRDHRTLGEFASLGWAVLTIWECELLPREEVALCTKIVEFMSDGRRAG